MDKTPFVPRSRTADATLPAVFGLTAFQAQILDAVASFGLLRAREIALLVTRPDGRARWDDVLAETQLALVGKYTHLRSLGDGVPSVSLAGKYSRLSRPLDDADKLQRVDVSTGGPVDAKSAAVPARAWHAARVAALDMVDNRAITRANYNLRRLVRLGLLDATRVGLHGAYYRLLADGARALNQYLGVWAGPELRVASRFDSVRNAYHTNAATAYLVERYLDGRDVWSEYALGLDRSLVGPSGALVGLSGNSFMNRFGRRPDGLVRLPSGALEVVEVENAWKSVSDFVRALTVLASGRRTLVDREAIEQLTFVVPDRSFDERIAEALQIFYRGDAPGESLPRYEGKLQTGGTEREKLVALAERVHVCEVMLSATKLTPLSVVRHVTAASLV